MQLLVTCSLGPPAPPLGRHSVLQGLQQGTKQSSKLIKEQVKKEEKKYCTAIIRQITVSKTTSKPAPDFQCPMSTRTQLYERLTPHKLVSDHPPLQPQDDTARSQPNCLQSSCTLSHTSLMCALTCFLKVRGVQSNYPPNQTLLLQSIRRTVPGWQW